METVAGIDYFIPPDCHNGSHEYLSPAVNYFLGGVPPKSVVLDMGCGNGAFLSLFRNRGWRLYGTDLSPRSIEAARQTYPDIKFVLADAHSCVSALQGVMGEADVIISTEVIEHLYDPPAFLSQCYELLRPDGLLVLSTPYHGYLKNLLISIAGKWDWHFTVLWPHGHIKFWSFRTLSKALADAGFRNIKFAGAGRFPYLWKSMVVASHK